jgi:crotonobetainyl-CoA:carnitine CoA-transferase CaiB-like acyl-CoA transferase
MGGENGNSREVPGVRKMSELPLVGTSVWWEGASSVDSVCRGGRLALRHLEQLGATIAIRGLARFPTTATQFDPSRDELRVFARDAEGLTECRLVGWGELGSGPCNETALQAVGGLMEIHGHGTGQPRRLGVDYVGTVAGLLAAQGILAIKLAQLRGSNLRRVEISAAHAALLANGIYLSEATATEETDLLPGPAGPDHDRLPPFNSADGVSFEMEVLTPQAWQAFWAALDAPAAVVSKSWWRYLLRYFTREALLPIELSSATSRCRYDVIAEVAARTGVGVCEVRTLEQRRADPDVFGADGKVAAPWTLKTLTSAAPASFAGAASARGAALPLAGLRVVEATLRIQGPFAGRVLRMLGADVTRIEPPGGDPLRAGPPQEQGCSARFVALNHGKQFVEIDLKSDAGRAQVLELVRDADVFLHNWAPGKAGGYGLDSAELTSVNPNLVHAYASGWGDALGPAPPIGTDYLVQAYAGVAAAMVEPGEPARPSMMVLMDVLGGLVAAEGVLAGLLVRERTGIGCLVGSSLLSASNVLLGEELAGGRTRAVHKAVDGGIDDVFGTADGWIVVTASEPAPLDRLRQLAECDLAASGDVLCLLRKAFAGRSSLEWKELLRPAGVAVTVVCTELAELAAQSVAAIERPSCAVVRAPWRWLDEVAR